MVASSARGQDGFAGQPAISSGPAACWCCMDPVGEMARPSPDSLVSQVSKLFSGWGPLLVVWGRCRAESRAEPRHSHASGALFSPRGAHGLWLDWGLCPHTAWVPVPSPSAGCAALDGLPLWLSFSS